LKKAVNHILSQKENDTSLMKRVKEGDEDPSYNQGVMIEIFDNKNKASKKQEVSLAEMFKAKKKDTLLKLDTRKQQDV
jgi:hypothetical protein